MSKQKILKKPKNVIGMYLHCSKCIDEIREKRIDSPRDYQRIQIGWTKPGLQVWCVRHNMEVAHFDFLGQKISYKDNT